MNDIFNKVIHFIAETEEGIPTIIEQGFLEKLNDREEPLTKEEVDMVMRKTAKHFSALGSNHAFQQTETSTGIVQLIARIKPPVVEDSREIELEE